MSTVMNFTSGECLCGQINVSVSEEALNATSAICLCHCKNCRQATGSLASANVVVPESAIKITGEPKIYHDNKTNSGTTIERAFCGNCGSPIYSVTPNIPGVRIVKMGLFDEIPKPSIEVYCKSRMSWNKPVDGARQYDTMPTQ